MVIRGNIDRCADGMLNGWVCASDSPGTRLELDILCGTAPIGHCVADIYRDDLQFAGFGDGRHGFAFVLPDQLSGTALRAIRVRISDSDVYLLQGAPQPDDEALGPVFQHLSRFGGLWIDRLDWIDQLGALTRAGVLDDAMGLRIMMFQRDGYLILHQAVDAGLLAAIRAGLDQAWRNPPPGLRMQTAPDDPRPATPRGQAEGAALLDLHRHLPELDAALAAPPALSVLAEIFAGTPCLRTTAAGERRLAQPFLQASVLSDSAEQPLATATIWLALSDSRPGDDSPVLLAGSHRARDYLFAGAGKRLRDAPQELEAYLHWMRREQAIGGYVWHRPALRAGDMVIHHADLLRGVSPVDPGAHASGVLARFEPSWLESQASTVAPASDSRLADTASPAPAR